MGIQNLTQRSPEVTNMTFFSFNFLSHSSLSLSSGITQLKDWLLAIRFSEGGESHGVFCLGDKRTLNELWLGWVEFREEKRMKGGIA